MLGFGTDGVRGLANVELTPELALSFARACAQLFSPSGRRSRVLVATDTRESADMIEAAVLAGICSASADAVACGVMPTPALAYLVPAARAAGGIMVSASHNPYQHNGLKFLNRAGDKIPPGDEAAIESLVYASPNGHSSAAPGRVRRSEGLTAAYRDRLLSLAPGRPLRGMRLVADCAHGALCELAPSVLAELGATVTALNCAPTGTNINDGGAVGPQRLAEAVKACGADAGVAFDGDGDRVVMADEGGELVDGDQLLGIWAQHLVRRNELPNHLVVGTVLTNGGLEHLLATLGCRLRRAPVGDRHVAEEMRRSGAALGGETCGHIIYRPHLSSSDALFTAIALLRIAARAGRPLSALAAAVCKRPQVSINLPLTPAYRSLDHPEVRDAIAEAQLAVGRSGRLVVRPSGTEPVLRITCEADDEGQARAIAEWVASAIGRGATDREVVHADIAA